MTYSIESLIANTIYIPGKMGNIQIKGTVEFIGVDYNRWL